jgi:sulfatase modifying factor 1
MRGLPLLLSCIVLVACGDTTTAPVESTEVADTNGDNELWGDATPPLFQRVEPGSFIMGSPADEIGRAEHEVPHAVTLTRAFWVQTTEVTQGQWMALADATNPAFFGGENRSLRCGEDCPVEQVDWYSALAFANQWSAREGLPPCYTLIGCDDPERGWHDGRHSGCEDATFVGLDCPGYRLPTEAEWEYATRAGTTTSTWAGNTVGQACLEPALDPIAWFCGNTEPATSQPVGTRQPNPWGLYDTLGSVAEWTWDAYVPLLLPSTDPIGAGDDPRRVYRGGSSISSATDVRSAARFVELPDARNSRLGFRLVRTEE